MPRLTVVELHGYREWTESLGHDREWIIQETQSRLYSILQKSFSKRNGFVLPVRYDYFIVLANGIGEEAHRAILLSFESEAPVPIRAASVPHQYPFTAQLEATRLLARSLRDFIYINGIEDPVAVVHVDYNNIRRLTYETSVYEAYMVVNRVYIYLMNVAQRYGGVAAYLGGDNIVAVLPVETYRQYIEALPGQVKAGVGVSLNPRRAMELASHALDDARRRGARSLVYVDDDAP